MNPTPVCQQMAKGDTIGIRDLWKPIVNGLLQREFAFFNRLHHQHCCKSLTDRAYAVTCQCLGSEPPFNICETNGSLVDHLAVLKNSYASHETISGVQHIEISTEFGKVRCLRKQRLHHKNEKNHPDAY